MKLGRISVPGPDGPVARLVRVLPEEGRVVDLARAEALRLQGRHAEPDAARRLAAAAFPGSMTAAIATGDSLLETAEAATQHGGDDASIPLANVTWLSAADPRTLRDGLTFLGHINNMFGKWGTTPPEAMLSIPGYAKLATEGIIGHEDEVYFPHYINQMDYELELGYVVGRRGRNLTPDVARDYLFGVTIFNDFSGRDLQTNEMQIGMGGAKSKDFANGIGPWITTIDEIANLGSLRVEVRVNGETWSTSSTANSLWSVDELLAYVSLGEYILPGDVIGSGTVGNGSALELDRKLNPGDLVELEVESVGILRNRMGQRADETWWPSKRDGALIGR
ncbi:fumarylacetoacetate hydrolase family protein [Cryptosporangium phraense]|uniref:Fumarylacetoacetate hydrolase family protein n=1 Tax=Cryptosporangium phraense TaxID=2593070 RepID=A0A545AUX7_9ACTN|nr:fumarylacetoacetate hydrolase family protein [Cryptosporangium phraense]TQS45113.1 fumarylacetoacetate hydrolase family protein [Cryptosporangium phraense]